jgi:uncharacterized membrane protein
MTLLRKAPPERLSALSDGVFAVLITVLVLELRPPAQPTFKAFLLLWPTWLSYAVSYGWRSAGWHRSRIGGTADPKEAARDSAYRVALSA